MSFKMLLEILKETFEERGEDKVARLAAALAYYTVFSLAPLLVIAIAVAGFFFASRAEARQTILTQVQDMAGPRARDAVDTLIENTSRPGSGVLATVVGVATLLLGASGVFAQLEDALNTVWEVEERRGGGIMGLIKDRFWAFALVLGTGFLLLVSLILSATLSILANRAQSVLAGAGMLWQIVDWVVTFAFVTAIFAGIFKVIPDVIIQWSDVWVGAVITAVLFTIGKYLISLYLGRSSIASTFGAAGSFIVLLVWIYYSSQILLLGAEFTQVYARKFGSHIEPAEGAVPLSPETRAQQGMPREESFEQGGVGAHAGRASAAPLPFRESPPPPQAARSMGASPKKASLGSGLVVFSVILGMMIALGSLLQGKAGKGRSGTSLKIVGGRLMPEQDAGNDRVPSKRAKVVLARTKPTLRTPSTNPN